MEVNTVKERLNVRKILYVLKTFLFCLILVYLRVVHKPILPEINANILFNLCVNVKKSVITSKKRQLINSLAVKS